jgi:hypothetical protein
MTLNLFRKSRQHPHLSAAAHYQGMVDYIKTTFAPPGCNIIAHENPSQRRTWATRIQHGYYLGPVMNHYRCQKVYISSTARERKDDTYKFFPHNYPMRKLSSTDRLLMTTNDMKNALKQPHPEVPFTQLGDDTITALAKLATILKNKFQKLTAPELIQAPLKAAENKQPAALAQPILTSPMQHKYQTRSQRPIIVNKACNTPLLLRVVTPMTGQAASPRVPARTQNISPRNLSQDDFWNMETASQEITFGTNHWEKQQWHS